MQLQTAASTNRTEIPVIEDVIPLCELAKNLAEAGEFESACEILRPFWQGLLHYPETKGLTEYPKAELLLRTGTLTGWLGIVLLLWGLLGDPDVPRPHRCYPWPRRHHGGRYRARSGPGDRPPQRTRAT